MTTTERGIQMSNRVVYKYTASDTTITVPKNTNIIHAGLQDDKLCIWAEVNPEELNDTRVTVDIVGTGHPIPSGTIHVGTFFQGPFVWHVYVGCA